MPVASVTRAPEASARRDEPVAPRQQATPFATDSEHPEAAERTDVARHPDVERDHEAAPHAGVPSHGSAAQHAQLARRAEVENALPRNAPEIPRVSLELPPESGLVLVETSHSAPSDASEPEAARPRRVRPPKATVVEEPLQMVETEHKEPPTI